MRSALGSDVGLPLNWTAPEGIETPADVFGGYLLLDAWIGNTDRHHENWALVVHQAEGHRYLAPTFDHASSLGAHHEDATRSRRLESKDPAFRVEGYVERARSALYGKAGDAQPMTPLDAFSAWREKASCDPWLQWQDLERGEADPLVMLARSGGRRETDMFEVFPVPERTADGRYRSTFFVHGLRHRGPTAEEEARRLSPGDALALEAEPTNPHDPRALRIHTIVRGVHIGFVPRHLCQDVHALLASAGEQAQARVQRVNAPPTPAQFRVLCSLDAPWPQDFRPLAHPDFEVLHAFVPVGRS